MVRTKNQIGKLKSSTCNIRYITFRCCPTGFKKAIATK